MGDRYAVTMQQATMSSSFKTAGTLNGVTTTRGRVYDWTITTSGTPADNVIQWQVMRTTASGTGTAVSTIAEVDLDGPVALIAAEENHTIEPTYTAGGELFHNYINQRAAYRWVAAPGGELMMPATSDAGMGWRALHASYASTYEVTAHWLE